MKVGRAEIKAVSGDLTKIEADAVCNPANSLMLMGGGVAGAIKRTGGEEIEKEAIKHAPVAVGRAIATSAGRLKARWVIHAPTMERPAMPTTQEKIFKATCAALRCAEEIQATSLAIPGMGAGVGGVPPAQAASAMMKALKETLPHLKNLEKIILCDINREMVEAWKKAMKNLDEQIARSQKPC